ncbi:DUF5753 domain-containing protein [Nocardia sp. NPDC056000]|uniref:DUF5753 domain-containing protein n=1 Tax=Nocardia sp. NPDC056000 TaxID=3345674 RepID=UPI0035DCE14F
MDFGKFMQGLRQKAPKSSMTTAALHIEVTRQVLDRLERGSPVKLGTMHINGLLDHYEATPEERSAALSLWTEIKEQDKAAKAQGNSKGFWKAYSDQVGPNFERFLRLEKVAIGITAHQPVIVPGLLQTPDYRRAILRINETKKLSAVDLERRVELNEKRQARLGDPDFRLETYLSEAVLRNRAGAPPVMAGQLHWLAEVGARDNVRIRVIPFTAEPHAGMTMQTFTLLELPTGTSGSALPPVVYAEGAIGSVFHEHDEEVYPYRQAIDGLRAVALSEEDTRDFLSQVAKEYAA